MLVALERFDLRIPGCTSLKEKRHVVKALTGSLRSKFNVSVSEVDHQDLWQRSQMSVVTVGSDNEYVRQTLALALEEVERSAPECVVQGNIEIV